MLTRRTGNGGWECEGEGGVETLAIRLEAGGHKEIACFGNSNTST